MQLSMSCQLLVTHTLPAGSMSTSTSICKPPPTYPRGGEIGSPVFIPGGQFSVRTPHRCASCPESPAKFEIQTLSLPSTAAAHGPGRLLPVNGLPGNWLPSGFSTTTLPPSLPPFCSDISFVK